MLKYKIPQIVTLTRELPETINLKTEVRRGK